MSRTEVQSKGMPGLLLGMLLFITSEVMFFGGLFASYFSLRAMADEWPPEGAEVELLIPAVISILLLSSSATGHWAVGAARRNDRRAYGRWMAVTILLGLLFLSGQALEYSQLPFSIGDDSFTTLFFSMTGFHGLHVLIGIVMLSLTLFSGLRTGAVDRRLGQVEAVTYYWHFVDVVWVLLFTTLYLVR